MNEKPEPRIIGIIRSATSEAQSIDLSADGDEVFSDVWDEIITLVAQVAAKHASVESDGSRLFEVAGEAMDSLQRLRSECFDRESRSDYEQSDE